MEPHEFKCKWLDKKEIWGTAEGIRQSYWPKGILPVDSEKIVEFRLRLAIEPKHGLFRAIDMDAYLKMDLTGIVVDYDYYMNDKYAARMRFSFAHEMGHFFLHREIISSLKFASPREWKSFIDGIPEKNYRDFEWQANEFAGRLLVPPAELEKEIKKVYEVIKENNELIRYLEMDPDAVLSGVSPMLCKPFGVSTDVIETRARREGLWPPNQ